MPATATSSHRKSRRKKNLELIGLRINAGLSREALGYRANVGRETVRLAEAGFVPGPRVQFAIAKVFDLQPLDIWPIEQQRVGR